MAVNRVLYPSKAQSATTVKVFLKETDLPCNPNGFCIAHIFGTTEAGVGLAGIQGSLTFSDNLEIVGLAKDDVCNGASFGLDTEFDFTVDVASKTAKFALAAAKADDKLTDGVKCITGVIIKPKTGMSNGASESIALTDGTGWRAGGTKTLSVVTDTKKLSITISDTAPIPTIITPTVTPMPTGSDASCEKKSKGDCSCDGKIDMVDWNSLRGASYGEGMTCDVNADGSTNALDMSIWINNNELIESSGKL